MIRKVKSLLQLAQEFPEARFSKEGTLMLNNVIKVDSEDLKYIGNKVESFNLNLAEEIYTLEEKKSSGKNDLG